MISVLGFNATSLQKNDPWQALPFSEEAGLSFVELTAGRGPNAMILPDTAHNDLDEMLRRCKKYGLGICSIGAHRDLSQKEQLQQFLKILNISSYLQSPLVTTGIPDGCNCEAFSDGLYLAGRQAESMGITICLETHGFDHGTGESLLPFTQVYPSIKLCYDTGNVLYYSDTVPEEDLPKCVPAVRHIHLKDKRGGKREWDFPAAGDGIVPFDKIAKILEKQARLSASIEIEFTPGGVSIAETRKALLSSIQYFRNLPLTRCDE